MATEIERKFLVTGDGWRGASTGSAALRQGYLSTSAKATVRIRIYDDSRAVLTLKGPVDGISRAEFEYAIPASDARALLATLCDGVLQKTRHHVRVDGVLFEVDEFDGDNRGLVVAEVELPAVDAPFPRPSWLGREVSALVRYYNVNLIAHPYRQWSSAERAAEDAAC